VLSIKRIPLSVVAVVAYCLSLALPVFYTESVVSRWEGQIDPGETWYGIGVLLFGWMAALGSPSRHEYWSIAWFANPLFFLALALERSKRSLSFPTAILGLFIAITSVSFRKIWNDKEPPSIIIVSHGVGFYLWLIAFAVLIVASWRVFRRNINGA
jgi:hypothetical protein